MNSFSNNSVGGEIRNISATLHEIKDEASQFVQTRFTLLKSELREKLPNLKLAAVLGTAGALFVLTAYLLLTLALVALVAVLFKESDYRWVFALLGIAILWSVAGGIALYFAKREFGPQGIAPRRTFEVLKGDKIWLEKEAKNQL